MKVGLDFMRNFHVLLLVMQGNRVTVADFHAL